MTAWAVLIRRPVGTALAALGLALLGLLAWRQLPVAALPAVDLPTIQVTGELPGAGPETMASAVATPLELRLGRIAGVSEMSSTSALGATRITLQFDPGRDIDGAATDVQTAIDAAAGELPKAMIQPPSLQRLNPATAPVFFIAATSDSLPLGTVYDLVRRIVVDRLVQVPGAGAVTIEGAAPSAVRITVDPARLAAMGIGLEEVRSAIAHATLDAPKGRLDGPRLAWTVAANDQLTEPDAYRAIRIPPVVGQPDAGPVSPGNVVLGDVARIGRDVADTRLAAWYNGRRAVFIIVRPAAGANLVDLCDRIRAALPEIAAWLPPAMRLATVIDRSNTIRPMVAEAETAVFAAGTMILLVMFAFLGDTRAAAIAGAAIPVSVLGTLALLRLLDISLDNISLIAITVSVGFVVDDSVVVAENIARLRQHGRTPGAAALLGTRRIAFTIIAITASLIATFVPLTVLGGVVGVLMREFAVTVCAMIGISAVVSLTLTPALSAALPARTALPDRTSPGRRRMRALPRAYDASLGWALRHRRVMLAATGLVCGLTALLFAALPKGFLPLQETGLLISITTARQDISAPAMAAAQQLAAQAIAADPAVESVSSTIGAADGTGQGVGRIYVALKPLGLRHDGATTVLARLRPALAGVVGLATSLQPIEDLRVGAREGQGRFQYTIEADDIGVLRAWLPRLLATVGALPRLRDVTTDQRDRGLQTALRIDRDTAARLGIAPALIDETLYDAFGQRQVATVDGPLGQYHVVLEVDPRRGSGLEALGQLHLAAADGRSVPLRTVVTATTATAPLIVTHQGPFPAFTISFNLAPGVALGDAAGDIEQAIAGLHPPHGLRANFQGNARAFHATARLQPLLLLGGLAAVYLVLGMLYESYLQPLTILSALPAAVFGALLGLWIAGMELSVISFIGLVLLVGLVKKNAIIMVDFARVRERRDGDPAAAIRSACNDRLRPIAMTSLTALLGTLPLLVTAGYGAEFRRPLGVTLFGGLLVAQLLTLYTVPVIYTVVSDVGRAIGRRKSG